MSKKYPDPYKKRIKIDHVFGTLKNNKRLSETLMSILIYSDL
jgi:hypothetical protein